MRSHFSPLLFGARLLLWAESAYEPGQGGYIGHYVKDGKHGVLLCVPPLGPERGHLYHSSLFTVLDPTDEDARGHEVRIGQPVVLVDDRGMVWNNKTGGLTGYVGPRPRGQRGEMYFSMHAPLKSKGEVVHFGDAVLLDVVDSHRTRTSFDCTLTNFKKPASKLQGGYVCCDGNGTQIAFHVHEPQPSVVRAAVRSAAGHKGRGGRLLAEVLPWGAALFVGALGADERVVVSLSNGGCVCLDDGQLSVSAGKQIWAPVLHAPTTAHVQLRVEATSVAVDAPAPGLGLAGGLAEAPRTSVVRTVACVLLALQVSLTLGVHLLLPHALGALELAGWWAAGGAALAGVWAVTAAPGVSSSGAVAVGGAHDVVGWRLVLERWAAPYMRALGDGAEPEPPVPARFMASEGGDFERAARRWQATRRWRRENRVDEILREPHRRFDALRQHYPTSWHKRARDGSPVLVERLGSVNLAALADAGVGLQDVMRHYVFLLEYAWAHVAPEESARFVHVVDVQGVTMHDFASDVKQFVQEALRLVQAHYPERARRILIVNVPGWFDMVWRIVSPSINEKTRSKVELVRPGRERAALLELIDEADVPAEYGGACSCDGRGCLSGAQFMLDAAELAQCNREGRSWRGPAALQLLGGGD